MLNSTLLQSLPTIIRETVAPQAGETDEKGIYPRESIQTLAKAGILAATTARDFGGSGLGPREACFIVQKLAEECPSTAMIVCMHFSASAVIEKYGNPEVRADIGAGKHLCSLAFSEQGSRSHFWAPLSTARSDGKSVHLNGKKSWVTSAGEADSYVWSSIPLAGSEASTIWLVPSKTTGLKIDKPFHGLGLRGNASSPISAIEAQIPLNNMLGEDGQGFGIMMGDVLPVFAVLSASVSLGIMSGAIARAIGHITNTRLEHLSQKIADFPVVRLHLAKAQIQLDQCLTLRDDTLLALETGRADAQLKVLEVKAAAGEAALSVCDAAMRICGGAAFRKEVGVERLFRDSRAASVMAPTSDLLFDFIGKAICGLPLF